MTQLDLADVTGGILAGGKGSRLGGQDKGWVVWQGKPLVEHVVERLSPQVGKILINCNRNTGRYEELGFPVVVDQQPDFQGPLAGVSALLGATTSRWLFICPCDGPNLPRDIVTRLLHAAEQQNAQIAVAADEQYVQPMHALIETSLAGSLEAFLQAGHRKPMHWYKQHSLTKVLFELETGDFFNINEPVQLANPA